MAKIRSNNFNKRHLAYATNLIRQICEIAGQPNLIEETRSSFREIGLLDAIQQHDDDAIYNWLAEAISYQGISDTIAAGYIEEHGTIDAASIRAGLNERAPCPKLRSYWHFEDCGYRKTARTCNEPQHIRRCPLPRHDLRNGQLNQAAYSLYMFMRDVAEGDFVAWIDRQLARVDRPNAPDRVQRLCDTVLKPLKHVHGVSDKVLNMTMASLLLAGDPDRERWFTAGAGMIAIDTLVHNWLHRSGILKRLKASHPYGQHCYGPTGCAAIIEAVAHEIDARAFNPDFPRCFPRFVQKAIWKFCAGSGFDQCNGNRIDDSARCKDETCPIFSSCARIALNPKRAEAIAKV